MEFIEHLKPLLMKSVKEHPFTFSGFLKSMYCPINASGLVIEIADLDYFNDSQKMEFFYNSDHWEFYLNAAAQFGFMVDKNIPWRLVADIGSNEMLQYARRYRLNTTGRILNIGYSRPDFLYFQKLRAFLHKIYEMVRPANITLVEKCNGELVKRTIVPEQYSDSELKILFDDKKLLTLMFEIRIQEEPKSFDAAEVKKIMRDCLSVCDVQGPSKASIIFERTINHPFDYRGSLSYIVNRNRAGFGEKIVLSKS